MKAYLLHLLSIFIITFIVLFDPDGAQYGLVVLPDMPSLFINLALFFGNFLWIFGVILFVSGAMLGYFSFDEQLLREIIEDNDPKKTKSLKDLMKKRTVQFTTASIAAVFAIGSGFEFTGTGWLIALIGISMWRVGLTKMDTKVAEEKDEQPKFSTQQLLEAVLLDDE